MRIILFISTSHTAMEGTVSERQWRGITALPAVKANLRIFFLIEDMLPGITDKSVSSGELV